jgi:uncharacterized protein YbjT (DUF2867 family)
VRVLVLGAGGFIGGRVCAGLLARGHDVVPCGRDAAALRRRFPGRLAMAADLARDGARDWLPRLAGLDAVVQAAGALGGPDLEAVHARGPAALFDACAAAGVAHLVQVSALGAGPGAPSRFHRTKRAADDHLLRLRAAAETTGGGGGRGGWCVLRPSLVVGRGGRSTALFTALAALPRPPRLGPGTWRVQPLHVEDLARAVAGLLEAPAPVPPLLDLVGPQPMTTDELTRALRAWLGLPEAPFLPIPEALLRLGAARPRRRSWRLRPSSSSVSLGGSCRTCCYPGRSRRWRRALSPSRSGSRSSPCRRAPGCCWWWSWMSLRRRCAARRRPM